MVTTTIPPKFQERKTDAEEKLRQAETNWQQLLDAGKSAGEFTDEQRTQLDAAKSDHATAKAELARIDEDIKSFEEFTPSAPRRKTSPDSLNVKEPNFLEDPKRGYKTHSEFLRSVLEVGKTGQFPRDDDGRLQSLAAGSDEHSTIADPYGGYLIPEGFLPGLLTIGFEGDPTQGRTMPVPMDSPIVSVSARTDKDHRTSVSGGLQVFRRQETQEMKDSRMEMEKVKLEAQMLTGLAYASQELIERSPSSFIALLQQGFGEEFGSRLINEKIHGTGAGEYEGILHTPCKIAQSKEGSQAAATIVYENIIRMRSRVWGYAGASWLANHDTLPQLMLMVQAGVTGMPIWQPSGREDHPDLLLGRPLFFTEYCHTLGTEGDIICGNWSQYLEGSLGPTTPRQAASIHVRFINHEQTFKFWVENDGKVWWRSALTPKYSTQTLSPFVTLETRS